MSGRALRRLPVLAHARYIGTMPLVESHYSGGEHTTANKHGTDAIAWLEAMQKVVDAQTIERGHLLQ